MSALLLEHAASSTGARRDRRLVAIGADHSQAPARGGLTLDELITGVWEGLSACQTVRCPACGGAMAPARNAGPRPVAGTCADCGSGLS